MDFLGNYLRELFSVFLSDQFLAGMRILYDLFPFWGPPLLAFGFYLAWINYIRAKFINKQKYVLLEIRLPLEVYKSPLAMELALAGFFATSGENTWFAKYIKGQVRAWFSLEIVSIGGNIHFYIWARETYRNLIEAQLYGQYPNIEIFEVPDYTETVPHFEIGKVALWGHEYKLAKPDPYPIKTYVDYGLDKDPKEEFKVDPLTAVLEFLATLKKGEQMWIQILIQAHRAKAKEGTLYQKTDVRKEGQELIKKLLEELREKNPSASEEGFSFSRFPTKAESEMFAAIDRATGKLNFDCGIRAIYTAPPEVFVGSRIPQFINILRPFTTQNLNSFTWRWGTTFDFPWQDFRGIRLNHRRREVIRAYRLRSWFHGPYKRKPFILSSEELATVFHFPGGVLQAPSVSRVMSKKSEAPINLPQ